MPSVVAVPSGSSCNQSASNADTTAPGIGNLLSHVVIRPLMVQMPKSARMWHQKRFGIAYSQTARKSFSVCRQRGWSVVTANCRGFAFGSRLGRGGFSTNRSRSSGPPSYSLSSIVRTYLPDSSTTATATGAPGRSPSATSWKVSLSAATACSVARSPVDRYARSSRPASGSRTS